MISTWNSSRGPWDATSGNGCQMSSGQTGRNGKTTPGALPVGTKLGKYEIVAQLGAGGQSIVYKGYERLLDRYVAIKQVAPQLAADAESLDRIRQITRQLARVSCEQIATILDLMEEPAGVFLVMELVEGHTIATALEDNPGPVEPKAGLQIIWRIAAGLAAIHKAGIVHRDLKPGNIIVGEGMRVKITDFGVAARVGAATSMRLGTTKYMAPELFSSDPVDARADIYSLGMIAYEMLVGREKFNEIFHEIVRDPHSESLRWMKWHSSPEQLAPLLTEVNPEVPAALSAIVERMLTKNPDERFQSVEELGREIRASFSARAVSGEGPKRRRLSMDAAAEAERRGAGAGLVAAEASDLTLPPVAPESSEPATAEIPKMPMSRGKKLALIGIAAGILMVALVTALVIHSGRQQQFRKEAWGLYVAAEKHYSAGTKSEKRPEKQEAFEAALAEFGKVVAGYERKAPTVADRTRIMQFLCRAQLAVLAGNRQAAGDDLRSAIDLNRKLQAETNRAELLSWTRKMEEETDEFRDYWFRHLEYDRAMEDADKAADRGEFKDALAILNDKADPAAPLLDQRERVKSRRERILKEQKQQEYWEHIQNGDELAKKPDVDAALAAYDAAIEVLETARKNQSLPDDIYKDLKERAEKRKTTLRNETEFAKAIAQAKQAESKKSLLAAADAYEKANKYKPEKKLLEKAAKLRHDHYLALGSQHLKADRIREAETELKKAQSYLKSAAVEAQLAALQKKMTYRQLMSLGDRLLRQRNYEGALEKYVAASKFQSDGELRGKIGECNFNLSLRKAEGFRQQQKWAEALREYNRAKRHKPDRSAEVDARIDLVKTEQAYAAYMAAAEEARKKGNWVDALANLQQAKAKLARPEVDEKIKQVRYEQYLAQGVRAMEDGDYAGAKAYLNLARNVKATAEVDKLIAECEKQLGGSAER